MGRFDLDRVILKHIEADPLSMEFYYCGRAARILVENLERALKEDSTLWSNPRMKQLWSLVTSAIPSYEGMDKYKNIYKAEINEIVKPEDIERLNVCLKWASIANEAAVAAEAKRKEEEEPWSNGPG